MAESSILRFFVTPSPAGSSEPFHKPFHETADETAGETTGETAPSPAGSSEPEAERANVADPRNGWAAIESSTRAEAEVIKAPRIPEINAATGTRNHPYRDRKRLGDRRTFLMKARKVKWCSPGPWCPSCQCRHYFELIPADDDKPSEFECVVCHWRRNDEWRSACDKSF